MTKKELLEKVTKIIDENPNDKIDGFLLAVSSHEGTLANTTINIDVGKSNTNALVLTKFFNISLSAMNKYSEREIFKMMECAEIPIDILIIYAKMISKTVADTQSKLEYQSLLDFYISVIGTKYGALVYNQLIRVGMLAGYTISEIHEDITERKKENINE